MGIFKSRYLKRFESSIDAFRISVRRALEFLETFESYILDGKVLDSTSFQRALRFLSLFVSSMYGCDPPLLDDNPQNSYDESTRSVEEQTHALAQTAKVITLSIQAAPEVLARR